MLGFAKHAFWPLKLARSYYYVLNYGLPMLKNQIPETIQKRLGGVS